MPSQPSQDDPQPQPQQPEVGFPYPFGADGFPFAPVVPAPSASSEEEA